MTAKAVERFGDLVLLPLVNLTLALILSGVIFVLIGENPIDCLTVLVRGAFGSPENIGYTLYYTTNVLFTGLSVAVAFHAGLFNIGAEGQAMIAGLGIGIVGLGLDGLPAFLLVPTVLLAAFVFGAGWAFIPAVLQAKRGSHIVITTIMFNFLAATLYIYLLVNALIEPGQMAPQSRALPASADMPQLRHLVAGFIDFGQAPLNLSFLLALVCAFALWVFLWQTPSGFRLRAVGANANAARFASIAPGRVIIFAMLISGALAGGLAINEIMGVHHRLLVGFTGGYGFCGIAVALMGRNHPLGILFASLLFGALYQGGAELAFDYPSIHNQVVVVIQGLVIIVTGSLGDMAKPFVRLLMKPFTAGTQAEAR